MRYIGPGKEINSYCEFLLKTNCNNIYFNFLQISGVIVGYIITLVQFYLKIKLHEYPTLN